MEPDEKQSTDKQLWNKNCDKVIEEQDNHIKEIEEEDKLSYGFLSAVQQNYKAISVYYTNLENNSNFLNISLNDINYFEKGDIISVTGKGSIN